MHLQLCGEKEKGRNKHARSLAGGVGWGEERERMTYTVMIRRNPDQSLVGMQLHFAVYFCYVSIVF
jgi:hypothetical protein